jgi:hypothetical protein
MAEGPPFDTDTRLAAWVGQANDALADLRNRRAVWWGYGSPCSCFRLVAGDPAGSNVAIMLFFSRYLAGPTSWEPQSLRIRIQRAPEDRTREVVFLLEDPGAGFRAEASNLHWARDVDVLNESQWRLWRPPAPDPA